MARILAKKTFLFKNPNTDGAHVKTQPMQLLDVPDWVTSSQLYKWAVSDGSIVETESRAEEAKAENDVVDAELAALREKAKELGVKGYASMKKDTLEAKIEEAESNAKAAQVEAERLAAEEAAKKAAGGGNGAGA